VTVLDALEWQVPESLKGAEQLWGRSITHGVEARLEREGIQLTCGSPRGVPAVEILSTADAFHADLIVVGSHGRKRLERFLLGSVAENVAKHATCPVLIARTPLHGLREVVLAIDDSPHSKRALRLAGHFPLPTAANLTVCHVVRPYTPPMGPEYLPDISELIADVRQQQQGDAEALVARAAKSLEQWGKTTKAVVRHGDPATEVLELITEQQADLVIVGARGLSAIQALLVGSVADRILKTAPCSVLLVH
jgi:nucleotide-binding universal stress UspA family protein